MGFAAYQAVKTNGEKVIIYFPKVTEPINMGVRGLSLSQLLAFSDFPIEATVLVASNWAEKVRKFGFPQILSNEMAGETLTLNNGSKMVFSETVTASSNQITLRYYTADGTRCGTSYSVGYSDHAYIGNIICLVGDDKECLAENFYFPNNNTVSLPGLGSGSVSGYYPNYPTNNPPIRDLLFFAGATPIYETSDPYGDGGMSEPGGGTGDFDGTGEAVTIPSLPSLSAVDAGFITLYNPTLSEINSLSSYMWSDLFDVDGWKKIFADPMSAILGLSIVPVSVPSSGTKEVRVGNISTGIPMTVATSQYVEIDCGTINVNEYWGAYLDYDPYTKAEIYLPYIGIHPISTDDIMNKPVHVVYHVDILSGACCAYVQCGGTVLYSFIGQCASSIPVTGDNWTNVINGAISIAGSIGSMVATGGASAPMAIGQIASTAVNTMKPTVEKSGAMGGTGGMLGVQTPYLILTRPRQALPRDQNVFIGYPSFITERLGDLSGYTEIDSIHLESVPATESELSEIENLLKSGVIF